MEVVMTASVTPASALDREFLGIRSRLIELAAAMDRIDRAGSVPDDPRRQQIRRSIEVLLAEAPHRAAQVQLEFSLPYDEQWRAD
jgi:hypothetical protein